MNLSIKYNVYLFACFYVSFSHKSKLSAMIFFYLNSLNIFLQSSVNYLPLNQIQFCIRYFLSIVITWNHVIVFYNWNVLRSMTWNNILFFLFNRSRDRLFLKDIAFVEIMHGFQIYSLCWFQAMQYCTLNLFFYF